MYIHVLMYFCRIPVFLSETLIVKKQCVSVLSVPKNYSSWCLLTMLFSHYKCLYSLRSDCKSDRAGPTEQVRPRRTLIVSNLCSIYHALINTKKGAECGFCPFFVYWFVCVSAYPQWKYWLTSLSISSWLPLMSARRVRSP